MASSLLGFTLISLSFLFLPSMAILSFCNGPCLTLDDCVSILVCSDGKCTDDPDVGSNICGEGGILGGELATCKASGTLKCGKRSYPQFRCSPPVTSSTRAKLTINGFQKGGEGGDPSECDGKFHSNKEHIVALSTGWYARGARCGKMIRITASNGRSVTAKVVDECDSINGCDHAHAGLPPCRNNVVDGSKALWEALGLNQDLGIVDVTWSMA